MLLGESYYVVATCTQPLYLDLIRAPCVLYGVKYIDLVSPAPVQASLTAWWCVRTMPRVYGRTPQASV